MGAGEIGPYLERSIEKVERGLVPSESIERDAPPIDGFRIVGLEGDRTVVACERLVITLESVKCLAEVVMGL